MPAAQHTNATIQIHVAVFLFGFTAILGDLIDMSAIMIVWWRVLITSISLWMLIGFGKMLRDLPRQLIVKYAGIGFIIGLHWITFYGARVCFFGGGFFCDEQKIYQRSGSYCNFLYRIE
ncbi:MAG: hypothetical protein IPO26_09905 [Saprospiraceae bacterium]|nr:hypothetical protein [Saprospiraceae bacterium]